jgi:hypothetical protein
MTQDLIPVARQALALRLLKGRLDLHELDAPLPSGAHLYRSESPPALPSNLISSTSLTNGHTNIPSTADSESSLHRVISMLTPLSPARFSSDSLQHTSSDSYESPQAPTLTHPSRIHAANAVPPRGSFSIPLKPSLKKPGSVPNPYVFRKSPSVTFSNTIDTREFFVPSSSPPILESQPASVVNNGGWGVGADVDDVDVDVVADDDAEQSDACGTSTSSPQARRTRRYVYLDVLRSLPTLTLCCKQPQRQNGTITLTKLEGAAPGRR